jgi:hypothetical protein
MAQQNQKSKIKNQKAKGKRQKAKAEGKFTFNFQLLPSSFSRSSGSGTASPGAL